jgi:hypothetical protein
VIDIQPFKIGIIIPYFGKWPEWIDLYFKSCSFNSFIDWHFFTDCDVPSVNTDNIYFHSSTFSDYCRTVSNKLEITFHPENPYKLCGLRPFYALIHKDLLAKYDFWGWGDVDVIWGDIGSFYTESVLKKYDVLSTHADRLSGHLTIIRNTPKYTELCFQIKNWQEKLANPNPIPMDEQDFSWLFYPESRYITKFYSKVIRRFFNWRNAWVIYYSIMPFVNLMIGTKHRNLLLQERHTTPILGEDGLTFEYDTDLWFYKDGKIINSKTGKESIYLHFMIYKKNSFRENYFWKEHFYRLDSDLSKGVKISKSGFESL